VQKCWRIVRQFVQDKNIRNNPDIVFVSISQRNENAVRPYVRSKKFYRIDNPVQLADKQICDSTSSNVFLYVGRLSEEKGVELFCQAVTELKTQYDIEGVVVGDGALLERLKDNYSEIRFEGWKSPEDVQKIMQISRVLVLPSKWYEGAPLTIIEAMSAGLPCVVSDCTSATEIVQDSINGYVFESGNVDSLKEKLIKTIDNIELLRVQKELLNTFRIERYMESTYIRNLTELYKELLL
jgi:glycosyltransferase involved in cell wall biosynthesis